MSEKSLIEAALFVAGNVVPLRELEKLTGLEAKAVKDIMEQIQNEYSQRDCGLAVEKTEKGYAMRVKPEYVERITPFIEETDLPKSMLKTLALIAHEQPIRQTNVVKMKGNRVYFYIHRLEDLGFIKGRPEGRTRLLTTTDKFREYFRLQDAGGSLNVALEKSHEPRQTMLEAPPAAKPSISETKDACESDADD
jgi:segregation and condensation protein B